MSLSLNSDVSFYKLPPTFNRELLELHSLSCDINQLRETLQTKAIPPAEWALFLQQLQEIQARWTTVVQQFGQQLTGELAYRDLMLRFHENIAVFAKKWLKPSNPDDQIALEIIQKIRQFAPVVIHDTPRINKQLLEKQRWKAKLKALNPQVSPPDFQQTIFIVSAPRSGSTLLYETLMQFSELWSINGESHDIIESIPSLHPAQQDYASNCLMADKANPETIQQLKLGFTDELQNQTGDYYLNLPPEQRPTQIRFLEKTPKNALRIPFLKQAFPDALFIYLYREPEENIHSIMEGWRSRRFIAYRNLPAWDYLEWSFLLPPNWQQQAGRTLAQIAAYQWHAANSHILKDLQALPADSWRFVNYQDLRQHPHAILKQLSEFAGLTWTTRIAEYVKQGLPLSKMTLSAPAPDKWRQHEAEIMQCLPALQTILAEIQAIDTQATVLKP
ncbi:sulfotransferase family protein [Beggiatoa alba B18LD]|uniref:Sulfotransferase family protein n=1 Tax=Beggiatoa alba B18LD TaxID=395493 RepID=I3CDY0_9GAMM|nr:sulfotransferase [Beggiatoa alba]EIJ41823.1 sulfotransferase family protein [Beggiatoa alba B18LD]